MLAFFTSGSGRMLRRLGAALVVMVALSASADEGPTVLRIGTGGTGGTYFPIGSLIAQAISATRSGDRKMRGVPKLLAVAQISNGSVANVDDMRAGLLDGALVQSDVAFWAYNAMAIFKDRPAQTDLRVVAHLYPESLHLVARIGSGIEAVEDLRGKRVSLDEPGSGTVLDARFVLEHYGISEADLQAVYLKPHFASEALARGELDAFFVFAGYPVAVIHRLAAATGARLVPIEGPVVDAILKAHPYFSRGVIPKGTYGHGVIPAGTYKGVGDTPTITVGAQLLMSARVDDELVYQITKTLWGPESVGMLHDGHPKGPEIRLEQALHGVSIPVHDGAARFYREIGLRVPDSADKS